MLMQLLYTNYFYRETDISTNRGNYLLIKLLRYRYPFIFGDAQVPLALDYLATNITHQGNS